ncbi:hypothetical protein ACEQ8H_002032 [Pleosporales sp. CAS-2024a]
MGLRFLPRPQPWPRKRSRAAADIDGEHSCTQKKKRRLRLLLITSRLSPQFSHPATNIVDRGSSKIAVWAKQRSPGRNLLRRAAILNHMRRRAVSSTETLGIQQPPPHVLMEQGREQEELALAKLEFNHGSIDTYTRPVVSRVPSVPPAAAFRTGGRFVVSGSPTGSPTCSRSPSPTSPTPPSPTLGTYPENRCSEYRSPNQAYPLPPPRAQLARKDYLPLPSSPWSHSDYYDALYADEEEEDEEPSTHLFDDDDDDDEDEDSVPFSPSAVTATSSATIQTCASQPPNTPPSTTVQPGPSLLDHGEAVFGVYDQLDDVTTGGLWSISSAAKGSAVEMDDHSTTSTGSNVTACWKRADSLTSTWPNFGPASHDASLMPQSPNFATRTLLAAPLSPNFAPLSPDFAPLSPNFAPLSPNFAPLSPNFAPLSPNFAPSHISHSSVASFAPLAASPNLVATAISPNVMALDGAFDRTKSCIQRRMSMPSGVRRGDNLPRRNSDGNDDSLRGKKKDSEPTYFRL